MITLSNAATGATIGQITEEQLQFLMDQFEEEWPGDDDYYINQDTLDMLQAAGAPAELIAVLQSAITGSGEADIRWARS